MTDALRDRVGHTSGPWMWDAGVIPPDGPGKYADIYVLDVDREPIILAEFNDSLPEGRANACLMAASPELLALVHQYRNDMLYPVAPDSAERRIAAIDAVLAKIEATS